MKKTAITLIALCFFSFLANAQKTNKKEHLEKIKALKIAFITEQLNLTSDEAEQFWPIYNKYDEKIYQLERIEKHKLIKKVKGTNNDNLDNITEEEAKNIIKKTTDLDKQIHLTKVEQDRELIKVLSYKKMLKLKMAEKSFVKKLMKRYRQRNKNQ